MTPRAVVVAVYARYPAVRAGLRDLLAGQGFQVLEAEALGEPSPRGADAEVLVADLGEPDPRAALARLEGGDALELPAVVLVDDGALVAEAVEGPARAWLLRDASAEQLAAAVLAVAAGLTVLDPALEEARALAGAVDLEVAESPLTEREQEVLGLLAVGLPNKAVARELGISEHTVKFHVGAVLAKLGAHSRTEAVTLAARRGLLTL